MSPYDLLRVTPDADDATIRQAYLDGIRRHPPTEGSDSFNRISRAYELISTQDKRYEYQLFGKPETVAGGPLAQVLDYARSRRPRPNFAVLRENIKRL